MPKNTLYYSLLQILHKFESEYESDYYIYGRFFPESHN